MKLTLTCNSVKLVGATSAIVQLVDPDVPADKRQDASRLYITVPVQEAHKWVPGIRYTVTVEGGMA